ncbi:glycosyltransferase family 2 protein [Halarcobacter ebronensis]|uniref:Glycosyltransferase 2-like domain-containing protein n=1 Tax=Halarcobacter ebronensis TaxID=1462615 RepID=A0A4Q1ANG0_9BACT|nr:glycosyltransferase family A protein [Halarcobacter ebronensis]QKF83307.1 glycosyltransferase, family 2 [Halarcobacter ebronensis]RXK05869.1 hypothetical protein CRV07_07295 [Halarcobacter ebronensis]
MKKASIVIPTFNRANFLKRALLSATSQVYSNLEIIVSDDCSDDNTKEVVEEFLHDDRVKYFKHIINKGQGDNYFYTIKELANGEWVFLLADDDYFNSKYYVSEVMNLVINDDVHMVLTNTKIDLGITQSTCHKDIHDKYGLKNYDKKTLIDIWKEYPHILDGANCFKRDIFFKGFGDNYKESTMSLVEDFDLEVLKQNVIYCPEASYIFTNGEHSLNKFKVNIYEYILILKSFVRPIKYALKESIFSKKQLETIYLKKWEYYCNCTSFVSSVLDEEFLDFVKLIINSSLENDNIFNLIEKKAIKYSKLYQKEIDKKIIEYSKYDHIYKNKNKKIDDAKTVIIYGTKIRALEYKSFFEKKGKEIKSFLDDFSYGYEIENVFVHNIQKTDDIKADLYVIATDKFNFVEKMYEKLINKKVDKDKIIA